MRFAPMLVPLALLAAAPAAGEAPAGLAPRLEALAEAGSGEAAYHLGMIHQLGLAGIERDPDRALRWFRVAAERGDPLGAYELGCFHAGASGGTVEPDEELALRHKLVAAEAGHAQAQQDVAQILWKRGEHQAAMRWLEAAARQGISPALATLAAVHAGELDAPGVRRDRALAYAYSILLLREFAREAEGVDTAEVADMVRRKLGVRRDEVVRGNAVLAEWRVEPTALTRRAAEGLDAAAALLPQSPNG